MKEFIHVVYKRKNEAQRNERERERKEGKGRKGERKKYVYVNGKTWTLKLPG